MRDKANNLIKKYRNKENLPIILFLIVLLNYFPLNLVNMFTKEAHAVSILPMAVCFAIEIAMLILYFFRKIEFTKEIKKTLLFYLYLQ